MRAIRSESPPVTLAEIDAYYDRFKEASDAFFAQLAIYRRSLGDKSEDWFVALWEEDARRWTLEIQKLIHPQDRILRSYLKEAQRYLDVIKRRELSPAHEIASPIRGMLKDPLMPDRAGAHWKTIEPLLLDLAAELALERVELDIRSIAWELDYVSVPVRIRLSLFGSALAIVESVKVARVRAYCLMDRGIYRAGDTIQAEGVTLTILRIEKDKITLGAGKYSRDFLLR